MFALYNRSSVGPADRQRTMGAFSLLLLCFSLGCLVSSVFGDILCLAPDIPSNGSVLSGAVFCTLAFLSALFIVVALFLSSTFLGCLLLPLLSFCRGYILSFTAATIIAGYHDTGVFMALTVVGIPALLAAPCFLALSTECFVLSRNLASFFKSRPYSHSGRFGACCAVCIPITAAAVCLEIYLVPYLVSLLKG